MVSPNSEPSIAEQINAICRAHNKEQYSRKAPRYHLRIFGVDGRVYKAFWEAPSPNKRAEACTGGYPNQETLYRWLNGVNTPVKLIERVELRKRDTEEIVATLTAENLDHFDAAKQEKPKVVMLGEGLLQKPDPAKLPGYSPVAAKPKPRAVGSGSIEEIMLRAENLVDDAEIFLKRAIESGTIMDGTKAVKALQDTLHLLLEARGVFNFATPATKISVGEINVTKNFAALSPDELRAIINNPEKLVTALSSGDQELLDDECRSI